MTAITWPIAQMLSKASFRCFSVIRSVYWNLLQGSLQVLYSTRMSTHMGYDCSAHTLHCARPLCCSCASCINLSQCAFALSVASSTYQTATGRYSSNLPSSSSSSVLANPYTPNQDSRVISCTYLQLSSIREF